MIIDSINKDKKKNKYAISINNEVYYFNEDIIIEFNLYKGKEISDDILNMAINSNSLNDYYNIALNYSSKYLKGKNEIKLYLMNKGLEESKALEVVNKLENKGIINDKKIIEALIYSYIKDYNGKNLIIEKLKNKRFDFNLIDLCMNELDYELYLDSLSKLYEKAKVKYLKYTDFEKKNKIKRYLYSRGYTYSEIEKIVE